GGGGGAGEDPRQGGSRGGAEDDQRLPQHLRQRQDRRSQGQSELDHDEQVHRSEDRTVTVAEHRFELTSAESHGAVLDLRGVGKTWPDGTVAVRSVDFDLSRGEFVSLVGPSGCGKSTVLRIVAGLEEQTSGRVVRPDAPPGCVFQQPNLLAWRNLARNVELYAELDGMPARERRALTQAALELVGLTGF